jgi:hypothetical protein
MTRAAAEFLGWHWTMESQGVNEPAAADERSQIRMDLPERESPIGALATFSPRRQRRGEGDCLMTAEFVVATYHGWGTGLPSSDAQASPEGAVPANASPTMPLPMKSTERRCR